MGDLLCCHTGHPHASMDAFLLAALLLPLPGWSSAFLHIDSTLLSSQEELRTHALRVTRHPFLRRGTK